MPLTWTAVQEVYAPEPQEHLARAQALGLSCPLDVFEQLFTDHHGEPEFARIVAFVDWSGVAWEEMRLSGLALRRVGVPRAYQYAVDEARKQTAEEGFRDEREEVMQHWQATKTWIRDPILLSGEVLQSALQYELVVGFTRLGNLLGAIERQDVPEYAQHTVWIGRGG